MRRAAMLAVLAVALSSSPVFAQQPAATPGAEGTSVIDSLDLGSTRNAMSVAAVELNPIMRQSLGQQVAVAAAASTSLVVSAEAMLPAPSPSGLVAFATPVTPEAISIAPRRAAPWWATTLAVAGPLADGLTTVYALRQSGPQGKVMEGNTFYHKLFGADVKPREILAFKIAQAAFMGYGVHVGGKHSLEKAVGSAVMQAAINFWVSSRNMRAAATARKLNAGGVR